MSLAQAISSPAVLATVSEVAPEAAPEEAPKAAVASPEALGFASDAAAPGEAAPAAPAMPASETPLVQGSRSKKIASGFVAPAIGGSIRRTFTFKQYADMAEAYAEYPDHQTWVTSGLALD